MWEVSLQVGNSPGTRLSAGRGVKSGWSGKRKGARESFHLVSCLRFLFLANAEKQGDNQEDKARSGEKAGSVRCAWAIPHDQTACFALLPPLIIELVLKTMTPWAKLIRAYLSLLLFRGENNAAPCLRIWAQTPLISVPLTLFQKIWC